MEQPFIEQKLQLEKFPGKGGWTYLVIEPITPSTKTKFGMVQVRGYIDDFELKRYKLMPMGNGKLFLPVRAEIRKKIAKQEGDWVDVVLFMDNSALEIPEEFLLCLNDDPQAHAFFQTLSDSEKKYYLDWIASAKKEETKVNRIVTTLKNLAMHKKFYRS